MVHSANHQAANLVFNERKKFIIIGLTGRTGSGCSSVAKLMATKKFFEFSPPLPKSAAHFDHDDDRKYAISYEYLMKNWGAFYHIQLKDLITTFILEKDFGIFSSFLSQLDVKFKNVEADLKALSEEFTSLHKERCFIKAETEKNNAEKFEESAFDFYFQKIPLFTEKIKKILSRIGAGFYTKAYQAFGRNIRSSGDAYNPEFMPDNIYKLSQRANKLIKILRKRNVHKNQQVFICLDAIRNPFEAYFFKERYSAFYLMSISSSEDDRKNRLRAVFDCSDGNIQAIDDIESPKKMRGSEIFFGQNIQKCIQAADIHIYNNSDGGAFIELKRQLVRYLSLIMHPGIVSPTPSERCMQMAHNAKLNSGCISRQVGAVVSDSNFAIKAVGWNNAPNGQVPCSLRSARHLLANEDLNAFSKYERRACSELSHSGKIQAPWKTANLTHPMSATKNGRSSHRT